MAGGQPERGNDILVGNADFTVRMPSKRAASEENPDEVHRP